MTVKEQLQNVLETLPDERLCEVLHFAEYLSWRADREEWLQIGQASFVEAYGPDEPEYTEADIKPELNS